MAPATVRSPLHNSKANRFSPRSDDSPSRQLQFELARALDQLQLHERERQKVRAYNRRSYHEELDARDLALARAHMAALEAASVQHEAVRQQAEAVLHRHLKDQEEQRRKQEEEEAAKKQAREREAARVKIEQDRIAKEEVERRLKAEQHKAAEAARKAAEEKHRTEVEEAKRKDREAAAQKEHAERERKQEEVASRQQADKLATQQKQAQPPSSTSSTLPAAAAAASQASKQAWSSDPEIRHQHYLALHKKLKTFRADFWKQAKADQTLKSLVGDMRRAMRTSVGQLTDDKVGNRKATDRVKTTLLKALNEVPSPPVTLTEYLPPHLSLLDKGQTKIPSLVLYLISIFSKAIINAFTGECAVNTKAAEPIGTLVAQVFSLPDLHFARNVPSVNSGIHYDAFGGSAPTPPMQPDSVSLISILMCKFHAVAPILFGISGPETTRNGRARLGWRLEFAHEGAAQKTFVAEQRHYERLTGLGAGYASIALRNFSKTKLQNPFPPVHFWESLSRMINTQPAEVQISHLILLRSMLENNAVDRFVLFFGAAGVAALRQALIELPSTLPPAIAQQPSAKSLSLLVETFKSEKNFSLT